jgi:hypothetical protein
MQDEWMLSILRKWPHRLFQRANIVANLTVENMALRQQIIVLKRNRKPPVLKERDRLFWVILSRIWSGWRDVVLIVQPDTVVRWHKRVFERLLADLCALRIWVKTRLSGLTRGRANRSHKPRGQKMVKIMCPQCALKMEHEIV